MRTLIIIFLLVLFGCGDEFTVIEKVSLGKVLDADVVPTSFNESPKTQIKTEKMFVVIAGTRSFKIGRDSFMIMRSNGTKWFCVDECETAYRMR